MNIYTIPNQETEVTSSNFKLDTVRRLWKRFFSLVIYHTSGVKWYLTKTLNSRMLVGGIKEGFTIPHIYKPQIRLGYLQAVVLSFGGLAYWGRERVAQMLFFSRTLKTGITLSPQQLFLRIINDNKSTA